MIYTSYWALSNKVPNPISISLSSPKYFRGERLPLLMPTWSMVDKYKKKLISKRDYVKEYIALLRSRGTVKELYSCIPDNSTLMCWEKSGEFCHRRVFALYVEEVLDIQIKEWSRLS